ncbi:hypothetical protein OAQ99_00700 [Candidatus Kapabacteria bacterium]|nr:hypothetical protein [Candidatus Kapabacteria bacterium]
MARIAFLIILISYCAFADGGSNYSAFGIGDIRYNNGAAFSGQGGVSAAIPSKNHINLRNPALWSKAENTILQFGYSFNQGFANVNSQTNYQTTSSIDGFLLLFSIDSSLGIAASMGLYEYSDVSFRVSSEFSQGIDGTSVSGQLIQNGDGGLNTAYVGASIEPIKGLSIGIMGNYTFGSIEKQRETIFNEQFRFYNGYRRTDALFGSNIRAGIYYEIIDNLSIGGFLETSTNFQLESKRLFVTNFNVDSLEDKSNSYDLPQMLGGGVSYKYGRKRFGVDLWTRDFSDFGYSSNIDDPSNYSSSNGIKLGFVREGNNNLGAKLLDNTTFRLGAGLTNLYYEFNGNQISEYYFSGGFSAKIGAKSNFDYSLVFGSRGENTSPLINETFIRMNFNVSIRETWFVPFKRGYDDLED